jgi:hypothetical protein
MHDTAVPTANFYRTQTSRTGRLDNACSAWLRYDSFQLLSSAHDAGRQETGPNLQEEQEQTGAWRLVRPQSV